MKIEQIKTRELVPYANNAKLHSDEQVKKIAASIKEFKFNNPVLIDADNGIIAGHGRVLAAELLKLKEVPCIRLGHLTEAQKKAYILADNRLGDIGGGWNEELLKIELEGLKELDFNIDLTGFDDSFLSFVEEPTEGLIEDDEIPEVTEPRVKLGEVWQLGNHRLLCGDCTDRHNVERLMNGKKADLVFTDPPYGMSYSGGRGKKGFGTIKSDDAQGSDLIGLVRDAIATARTHCKDGASTYVCFPWRTYSEFESALESVGIDISSCIVWNKGSIGLGHQEYRPQHEFIFYSKGGSWYGDRSQSDVWTFSRGNTGAYVHPTQKPVELVERAIQNSSKSGDTVIDCFGGSGSTLIACEKLNRTCYMMELSPEYCDVIINRWEKFTGETAVKC